MTGVEVAVMVAAVEWEQWLQAGVLVGGLLLVAGVARMVWARWSEALKQVTHQAGGGCPCLACTALADEDADDCGCGTGTNCDPLMDPIVDIFADEIRPVNEHRPPSVWSRLDAPSNRGRRFDDPSRARNERLVRWLSVEQQELLARQAGPQVIAEAEALLRSGETTGEIRRGDPGE